MRKEIAVLVVCLTALCACSSIDCPINNLVYSRYSVLTAAGATDTLHDTLTVFTQRTSDGQDTILLNKAVKTTALSLPMSYAGESDCLIFMFKGDADDVVYDTVVVSKSNEPHFESTDCAASYFHTVSGISHTTNVIDSISVVNNYVTNDANATHFNVYFHPGH